ncbi:MAG: nucleotide exchange factor GrpE [Bacteroidaceae bacterium]|nr:nucleotide exchange factor GrpE [Bacteroidaceae bacterium]
MAEEVNKEELREEKNEDLTAEEAAKAASESADTADAAQPEAEPEKEEEEKTPEMLLAEALAEIAELKDRNLRQLAEFDNYRKRTIKEKTELILNGSEKTVSAILPVLDDFERALKTMDKAEEVAAVREGVELIFQKFIKVLADLGVTRIETDDADFDVDIHEAIAQIPAPSDEQKGKVIDCVQTGYKLNDKVIRHAKVAVGV